MKAILLLEDGTEFAGEAFGARGTVVGEIVFNTVMTGYQEVLTDPSCFGQIVAMTYPLIGNYGVNEEDCESSKPQVKGFIAREICDEPSNWRSSEPLNEYLTRNGIIGLQGIDTRALTRILREKGTMNGVISTDADFNPGNLRKSIHDYRIINPIDEVTIREVIKYEGKGRKVALIDYGVRKSTILSLRNRGCEVYVFPASYNADQILSIDPDGILLSNGPGNPKNCYLQIEVIKELLGKRPIFGIGLGHQLTALANGGETVKMKHGHRGANHPVKDIANERVDITAQNHGYVVAAEKLDPNKAVVTHINMNDGTVEGIRYSDSPTFTVQFKPMDSPGIIDKDNLFGEFIRLMDQFR